MTPVSNRGINPETETLIERADEAVDRGYDAALTLGLTIERSERIKTQIERRLKIEGFFVFVAVASFLGCLAVRFG